MFNFVRTACLLATALSTTWSAHAADATAAKYPAALIKLVVPYPPGGTVDIVGRLFAQALTTKLGQQVIVDNRPGAGTIVGTDAVAKSKPDGYTLLVTPNTTMTIVPLLYAKRPYQQSDLDVLGLIATTQFVITANKQLPANNIAELVALAKKEPDKLSFGSFGNGTTSQLGGEQLNQMAGIKIQHVPYKGAGPALQDLIGNNISIMVDAVPAAAVQIKGGSIKALAVTGLARSELLPDVPTVAESGYPHYRLDGWIGLVAPAGLPDGVRQIVANALSGIAQAPEFQKSMRDAGMEPLPKSMPPIAAVIKDQLERHRQVIEKAHIRID